MKHLHNIGLWLGLDEVYDMKYKPRKFESWGKKKGRSSSLSSLFPAKNKSDWASFMQVKYIYLWGEETAVEEET